jgi:hypothetical protein
MVVVNGFLLLLVVELPVVVVILPELRTILWTTTLDAMDVSFCRLSF